MNKTSERYNTKVEVPISVILETIFSDDNQDVETLSRWAKKYGFVDLIEKEGRKYYQLQNDYTKQNFYILLDKEERKQYDYEDYLLDENEKLQQENKQLREKICDLNCYLSSGDFKSNFESNSNEVYIKAKIKDIIGLSMSEEEFEILKKIQELEKGDSNEQNIWTF